ncbi:MAG: hypothetical protein JAZ11_02880 [Candidatus Thiodiazotropha lotti]|nr:hypothetical protein [Candidatus Thiodiazotropha lotti]
MSYATHLEDMSNIELALFADEVNEAAAAYAVDTLDEMKNQIALEMRHRQMDLSLDIVDF